MITADPMIIDTARSFLQDAWLRGDEGNEHQRTWQQATELGFHLIGVDEDQGGIGGSLADRVAVARELGRAAQVGPYLEAGTATARLRGADGIQDEALTAGTVLVTCLSDHDATKGTATIEQPLGPTSAVLGVIDDRIVHGELGGELRTSGLDAATTITSVGGSQQAPELAALVRGDLLVLRAARLAGACLTAFEIALRHAAEREQFGRPLLKFQAVAALLAESRALVDLTDAAVRAATVAAESPQRAIRVEAAARVAEDAAGRIARSAHQVHGAIGITREHHLHRVTRRLWTWRDQIAEAGHHSLLPASEHDIWEALAPERAG